MDNKKIIKLISIITVLIVILMGCSNQDESSCYNENYKNTYERLEFGNKKDVRVAENSYLELLFNPITTVVTVVDKRTGEKWTTNPSQEELKEIKNTTSRNLMASQLYLQYYTQEGKYKKMNNYEDSIVNGQFEVYQLQDGIKVYYTLGEINNSVIPDVMSEERYNTKILEKASDEQKQWLKMAFTFIDYDKISSESQKETYIQKYPQLEEVNIYEKRELTDMIAKQVEKAFVDLGYTLEDKNKDHEQFNIAAEEINKEVFEIPVEYRLDDDNLVVSIPCKEVKFDDDFKLTEIQLLEGFSAATAEDEGYMFIPDGAGALVYLNNEKESITNVPIQIYGKDDGIYRLEEVQMSEVAHFPVFGMKKNNKAFFAIIEDGDAYASVVSTINKSFNPFNRVSCVFTTLNNSDLPLKGLNNKIVKAYEPKIYDGEYKIRYSFLYDNDASYVGMANYYRDYLINNNYLSKKEKAKEDIPFVLEVIGAINKIEPVLGIPMDREKAVTTFDEAKILVDKLKKDDINNIKLKYSGWCEGGLRQKTVNKFDVEGAIGGKKGFRELNEYLKEQDIAFYPSLNFQYVDEEHEGFFTGFNKNYHASRFLNRNFAFLGELFIPSYIRTRSFGAEYVVNPALFPKKAERFISSSRKYDIDNISFKTFGNCLNGNYDEKSYINRQQSLEIQQTVFNKYGDSGYGIMINGGSLYALPYADTILNIPVDSSRYYFTDESIPFMQIVLHGYVEYSPEPINLAGDFRRNLLKCIETGASPYYKWIYRENDILLDTEYTSLYSVNYKVWYDEAIKIYREFNDIFKWVKDKTIVGHEKLQDSVYMTTYEGGTKIIVNYKETDVKVNGITIEGASYYVLNRGDKK